MGGGIRRGREIDARLADNPDPSSERELGAELEQPPAHNLDRVHPLVILGTVPRLLVEDGAPVEDVVGVDIPPQLRSSHREGPAKTEIQLLDPIVVECVGWDQVDGRGLITGGRGLAGACRQVPAKRCLDLSVSGYVARCDREPWKTLIDRAGLEFPRQRIDDLEFDLRRGCPRPADVAEPRPRILRRYRQGRAAGRAGNDRRR